MKIAITGHTSGIGKYLFDELSKDNEVIGVFRSEAALEDAMERLEAESKPAPVKKPKTKKKAKKKKEK